MSSSVFFKFKSQKEPTRVEFDGTGISVFELKREIILRSGLGDGSDFDLVIYADEEMKEVYDDDTTIIPRSTTVVARRLPAKVPGRGGAARYVSGKMPAHAKNHARKEQSAKGASTATSKAIAQMNDAMTEEEKMNALFNAQSSNWQAVEETLSHQSYIPKSGAGPKRPVNVPDHDPPQGYICYRCGEKGHWIQLCPTNENPEFDNRPRMKRTTGIPRSFLKTVDKETALGQHGEGDESKVPSGIMVNADGDFVIAEPDKAAWEKFQAKAQSNAAQKTPEGDKEVQERGLECAIDKKMFIEPMKTPCCERTYCNECITNALIESDFVCPGCKSDGVLLDDLKPDEVAAEKIKDFLAEKSDPKKEEASKSPKSPTAAKSPVTVNGDEAPNKAEIAKTQVGSKSPKSPTSSDNTSSAQTSQSSNTSTATTVDSTTTNRDQQAPVSKKRPAEEPAENPKIPKAPKAMQKAHEQQQQHNMMQMMNGMPNMAGMNGMNGMNGMGAMAFNPMNMMTGFPPMGNMGMGIMNPMMNPMMMNPMMGNMGGFPNMNGGMNGNFGMNGGVGGNFNGMAGGNMWGGDMNGNAMNGMNMGRGQGPTNGGFAQGQQQQPQPQQQQPAFKQFNNQPPDEDDAYMRKPVNPHRHQNRQRRIRPSDYREL